MSIGNRLRSAIDEMGVNMKEYSISSGIPYRTLMEYLSNNRSPGAEALMGIAGTGINIQWLLTGVGGKFSAKLADSSPREMASKLKERASVEGGIVTLPIYDPENMACHLSSDEAFENSDQVLFPLYLIPDKIRSTSHTLMLLYVRGDAMDPTVHDGDVLLFDKDDDVVTWDGLHVMWIDQFISVRRLQREQGGLRVISDNPKYPSFLLNYSSSDRDTYVVGRVVWLGRNI